MERATATLRRYSPSERMVNSAIEPGSRVNAEFFETPASFHIGYNVLARSQYDTVHKTQFFYLGTTNSNGVPTTVSYIKFSHYEAGALLRFIRKILDEINAHPEERPFRSFIPYFDGKEERAKDILTKENKVEFWAEPDIDSFSFRGRLTFNGIVGCYQLHLNAKVPAEVTKKLKGNVA